MTTRQQKVVTWQAPSGETINVCPDCHEAGRDNIKTSRGEDYCSASYGLHYGLCDFCQCNDLDAEINDPDARDRDEHEIFG